MPGEHAPGEFAVDGRSDLDAAEFDEFAVGAIDQRARQNVGVTAVVLGVSALGQLGERRAEIVSMRDDELLGIESSVVAPQVVDALHQPGGPREIAVGDRGSFGVGELSSGNLAHGFEEPVGRALGVDDDQRTVEDLADGFDDVAYRGNLLQRGDVEPTRERC